MKFKRNVIIPGLDIMMRRVLIEADKIWRELGQELVVTSALDGVHSAGSLHYYGRALDFRINYFTPEEADHAADMLRRALPGNKYDVVRETTHIHAEFDPK